MLHLKHIVSRLLDMLSDLMTVRGTEEECPKNEHIERALKQLDVLVFLSHGRHSTIVIQSMVDIRPQNRLAIVSQKSASVT